MTDLAILALGFGLLPFVAAVLLAIPEVLRRNETALWGLLVGIVAFLGLAHAGSTLLEGNALLRYEVNPWTSALVAAAGLLAGIALAWRLLARGADTAEHRAAPVVVASAVFIGLHSFSDGLVLGLAYVGPFPTGVPLDLATVAGSVLHRFAEGALVLITAILAGWRPQRSLLLPIAGAVTIPAAFIPGLLLGSGTFAPAMVALEQALAVFASGLEAGFAILFLLLGLLPRAVRGTPRTWAAWAGVGFTLLLLVHFLVE